MTLQTISVVIQFLIYNKHLCHQVQHLVTLEVACTSSHCHQLTITFTHPTTYTSPVTSLSVSQALLSTPVV